MEKDGILAKALAITNKAKDFTNGHQAPGYYRKGGVQSWHVFLKEHFCSVLGRGNYLYNSHDQRRRSSSFQQRHYPMNHRQPCPPSPHIQPRASSPTSRKEYLQEAVDSHTAMSNLQNFALLCVKVQKPASGRLSLFTGEVLLKTSRSSIQSRDTDWR